jgi:ATP-dependent Zn protease
LAQITILIAGIAAETVAFGAHGDGGGGGDDSDLRHATLIAAAMDVSYGLGDDLIYLASSEPHEVFARVRADPMLRQHVASVLEACMQRARTLIEEHREFFDEISRILRERGSITNTDVEEIFTSEKFCEFLRHRRAPR